MRSLSLYTLAVLLLTALNACAQTKKTATAGSSAPLVLEATQQRTKPGRQDMHPYTTYRFRIVWKANAAPNTFYWRPDAKTWMEAGVAKPIKRPGLGPGDFMIIEKNININEIRYNDTLIITTRPHAHEKEPMPAAVKKMPVNSLYYRTSAAPTKWIASPITVKRLADIYLP